MHGHRRVPYRRPSAVALIAAMLLAGVVQAQENVDGTFPQILWKADRRLSRVRAVTPSPVDPDVAFVTSDAGLHRTRDGGATWTLIPKTDPDTLGTIVHLAVCPGRPEFVVLAAQARGVFLSTDGGDTWHRGGGSAAGLSSMRVCAVTFSREDRAWRTLLVSHDEHGVGISKSIDGGKHWRVLAPMRHFRTVISMGQELVAASATVDEPDNWQLVRSNNYGESWHLARRDAAPTVGARVPVGQGRIVWGSRGGLLMVSEDDGVSYVDAKAASSGRWNSVFVTPGRTPRDAWCWAYDPFRHGLLVGRNPTVRWTSRNRGLYVNRMTRRGANVAAAADALTFYACVNGTLSVGTHVMPDDAPVIRRAGTTPAVLRIHRLTAVDDARRDVLASCRRVNHGAELDAEIDRIAATIDQLKAIRARRCYGLRVRVEHPKGVGAVRSVTVTPDLFGLGPVTLHDDGKHDDDKAGDGLWGAAFSFTEEKMWDAKRLEAEGRQPFPGTRGVPVAATDVEGHTARWTLPVTMVFIAESLHFGYVTRTPYDYVWGHDLIEGKASIEIRDDDDSRRGKVLTVKGGPGPWRACRASKGGEQGSDIDVTGLDVVTFMFRGEPGSGDVEFFLVDHLTAMMRWGSRQAVAPPDFSIGVPLLASGCLPAMDGKFHKVTIPLKRLIGNTAFKRRHLAGIGLRAPEGATGGVYDIGEVTITHE